MTKLSSKAATNGAVIYCRVSTKEQVENMSLKTQEKICREYCRTHSFEVQKVFIEEGESARTTNRTKLQEMLSYVAANKQRVSWVVVYNVTRFSRRAEDFHAMQTLLAKYAIRLVSVTETFDDTPGGKFMGGVLALVAQFENDVRGERAKEGMRAAAEEGRWAYKAPLGYLGGGKEFGCSLRLDPTRAPLIRQAFESIASGAANANEALRQANRLGLRTTSGNEVNTSSFNTMLRKPVYAGWITSNKWPDFKPVRGDFEPLISQETFDQVQLVMSGKNQLGKIHFKNHPDFPLRRFVRCGYCEHGLTASWSKGRSERFPYYRCSKCKKVNVRKEKIEAAFTSVLTQLRLDETYLRLFEAVTLDVWKTKQSDLVALVASGEGQLQALLDKRDRLEDTKIHRGDLISDDTYRRQHDKIEAQIFAQRIALSELKVDEMEIETVLSFTRSLLSDPHKFWFGTPPEHRPSLLRLFFPHGLAFKDGNFGTIVTGAIFKVFSTSKEPNSRMATRHGLEP